MPILWLLESVSNHLNKNKYQCCCYGYKHTSYKRCKTLALDNASPGALKNVLISVMFSQHHCVTRTFGTQFQNVLPR